jgi:hypothetical protein
MKFSKIKLSLFIVFISLIFNSCHFESKENYLKDFSNFIVDIENNYQKFTEENWKAIKIDYENFIGEKYEQFRSQFTEEDLQTIGKLKARYFKIVLKSGLEDFKQDIKEGAKQMEGFVQEIIDSNSNNKLNENE